MENLFTNYRKNESFYLKFVFEAEHYPVILGSSNFTGSELIERRLHEMTKGLRNYKPGPLSANGHKIKVKDMRYKQTVKYKK